MKDKDSKSQTRTIEDRKNRTETGQTKSRSKTTRLPKTHQDYWRAKLKRRAYVGRTGERAEVPEWQVRMFHQRRESWFNLDTANQAAAAVKARDIYLSLISVGWEATLERYKPGAEKQDRGCTVGEFLADVGKRSHLKPATLRRYAVKLRKMVSDIAKLEVGLKAKARRAKYDYVNGGRAAWLAKIDGQPLDVLTPDSVNAWRNAYVARAGSDPTRRKSAERSAASYLRCTRALFTPDVLNLLKVNFPANPYEGMKLKDPGPQRYHSDVNAEWLLACAQRELWPTNRQEFLGLVLALWAGLRRKEADLLLWEQVDLAEGCIHLRRSKWFEPKTEESQRTIDLAATAVEVLKEFKNGCVSEFVMEGAQPNPAASYDYYRCDCTWRRLNAWLKEKGVKQAKAIHGLRKESGSLVAADFGIEAARQHLGHRDIRVTSAHYVAKRKRVEVSIGGARLRPLEVADES